MEPDKQNQSPDYFARLIDLIREAQEKGYGVVLCVDRGDTQALALHNVNTEVLAHHVRNIANRCPDALVEAMASVMVERMRKGGSDE